MPVPPVPPVRCPTCQAVEETLPSGRTRLVHDWSRHTRTALSAPTVVRPPVMVKHWTDDD